jgi:hypothetical protein
MRWPENKEEPMNHNAKQSVWSPLAHIGQRVAALVTECNYVQMRLTSLQNTPSRF